MPVESGWGKAKPARPETQAGSQRRAMAYRATLEEDAELLKIFERKMCIRDSFKIEDGAISNIFLNEACSSGCGSFLQTFAPVSYTHLDVYKRQGQRHAP